MLLIISHNRACQSDPNPFASRLLEIWLVISLLDGVVDTQPRNFLFPRLLEVWLVIALLVRLTVGVVDTQPRTWLSSLLI